MAITTSRLLPEEHRQTIPSKLKIRSSIKLLDSSSQGSKCVSVEVPISPLGSAAVKPLPVRTPEAAAEFGFDISAPRPSATKQVTTALSVTLNSQGPPRRLEIVLSRAQFLL